MRELAGQAGRAKSAHHLVIFRNDDFTARNFAQIVRHRRIGRDTALEEDLLPALVEQQLADAVQNRTGLSTARPRQKVAQRDAVLEFVDGRGGQHRADGAELDVRVVVDFVGNLLNRHAELRGDAVQIAARARRADAGHHGKPHAHLLVVDHALAVLPAAVDDGVHIRIVMFRARHMGGHFAHLEVIVDDTTRVLHDLAARHDRAGDVLRLQPRVGQKRHDRLADGAHVATAAGRATPRASDWPGVHRLRPLVCRVKDVAVLIHHDRLERRRTDVYSQISAIVFFHAGCPSYFMGWAASRNPQPVHHVAFSLLARPYGPFSSLCFKSKVKK